MYMVPKSTNELRAHYAPEPTPGAWRWIQGSEQLA